MLYEVDNLFLKLFLIPCVFNGVRGVYLLNAFTQTIAHVSGLDEIFSCLVDSSSFFSVVKGPAADATDAPQQMLRTHRSLEAYCATL